MSTDVRRKLELFGLLLALAISVVSAITSLGLIPYRVSALEVDVKQVKADRQADHDLLGRIDERTQRMEKTLDRLAR